jgi:hypothetical protein
MTAFLAQVDPAHWRNAAPLLAQAHMIRGFLREQQDDAEGAQAAWRRALGLLKRTPAVVTCEGFLLCSLGGDLTESDVAYFIEQSTGRLGIPAANYVRKGGIVEPGWLASVMRQTWRNPRGRDYARRVAFRDLSVMDSYGIQFALFVAEAFRQGAMAGRPSAEQDALIWGASEGVYRSYTQNEFSDAQAFLGLTAWTGTTGFLGWGGLSASLQSRPDLRGPLAYLYGQRYLRLGKKPDARALFQAALRDARPNTPLHRLAQEELNRKPAEQ